MSRLTVPSETTLPVDAPGTVILQEKTPSGEESWLLYTTPVAIAEARRLDEVVPVLTRVEQAAREGRHAAGFLCYEAAPALDRAFVTPPAGSLPLAWFAIYDHCSRLRRLPAATGDNRAGRRDVPGAEPLAAWTESNSDEEHAVSVARIREYIAAGDVYQVNLTHRLRTRLRETPWNLFRRLVVAQGCSYAAWVATADHLICSVSPELFFRLDRERIECRPMKGTAPRGREAREDEILSRQLTASPKERAENLMITDMVRNDLGRIAETGTVRVEALWDLERYETVWQLTSTVAASTRAPLVDIFRALFPGASVTGAPKIRAMEIIAGLEPQARGIYTGCIGRAGPGRDACFNLAIRTAAVERNTGDAEYGTGGGIVWDSEARSEREECRHKARLLSLSPRPDFRLFETIRVSSAGSIFLHDRHLERLASSARYFGFRFNRADAAALLREQAALLARGRSWRVRLFLARDGALSVDAAPTERAIRRWTVSLATAPVDGRDPLLFHKTTHRELYDAARRESPGADDVLLWNRQGELTESTRANVAVRRQGVWVTPGRDCGLLPGTFRQALLERGWLREGIVRVEELGRSESLVLLNSLRGVIRVERGW